MQDNCVSRDRDSSRRLHLRLRMRRSSCASSKEIKTIRAPAGSPFCRGRPVRPDNR